MERKLALYNYLLEKGDNWTIQEIVAFELFEHYSFCGSIDFHNTNGRKQMTKDIQEINESDAFDKIIISSSKGIKLANEKEFDDYIKRQYASVFRKLKRVRKKEMKAKRHNNCEIYDDTIKVISALIEED